MTRWAAQSNCLNETQGADSATSRGELITANSTAGNKGGWVDLGSATTFDYQCLWVAMTCANAGAADFVIDIGLTVGANRAVIMPDLRLAALAGSWTGSVHAQLPLFVPAGSQLAARCAASTGSRTCHVAVTGASIGIGGAPGYAYGVKAYTVGSARGQDLDPTTANTMTGWTQLGAPTSVDFHAMLFAVGPGGQSSPSVQRAYLLDLGRNSVGNEAAWITGLQIIQSIGDERPLPSYLGPFPIALNNGGRIFARCQTTEVSASERKLDVAAWGFVK